MSSPLKNYYRILKLNFFESNQGTIKNAYLKKTEYYHPNSYKGDDLRERLIDINEAFLVLSDTSAKKLYDKALSADSDTDYDLLTETIRSKNTKAESFISSYFSGTQKKKTSVWKFIGIILLILFTIGTIGRIVPKCTRQYDETTSSSSSTSISLGSFNAPSDWNYFKIDDSFSFYVPPTLELRNEFHKYTQFLSSHHFAISNADAIFQQADLSNMNQDALSTYCRIMVARYYVGTDNAEHHYESPELTSEDYSELKDIADGELGPWSYISSPTYKWVNINGTKAVDISYSRQGTNGEVLCHIYLFLNYDEIAKIITSYRKVDESKWRKDIDNVIKTFKWSNPK